MYHRLFYAGMLLCILMSPKVGYTTPIGPGFDLFETQPGTLVNLTAAGLGIVQLEGIPIDPMTLGATDTIIERRQLTGPQLLGNVDPFNPGFDTDDTGVVEIELVALSLRSVNPVNIGGTLFDVFVGLNPGTPSIGTMEITHGTGDGGSFMALVDVFALLSEVGDPMNTFDIDPGLIPLTALNSTGTFSHIAPPGDVRTAEFPAGDFFIVDINHVPPPDDGSVHQVFPPPPIPEPATLLLFAVGLGVMRLRAQNKS